jgi:hypothetical protein
MEELLIKTRSSLEHPIYHPERYLSRHIALVMLRCLLYTENVNMVLAALFHDLHKPTEGAIVAIEEGVYWQNKFHSKLAAEYVLENDDARYLIKSLGGRLAVVHGLVKHHMDKCVTRRNKHVPNIELFFVMDDMIGRYEQPKLIGVDLPKLGKFKNGNIALIGQSPIQQHMSSDEFTIIMDRTPFTYNFNDIYKFFNKGFAKELQQLVKLLNN